MREPWLVVFALLATLGSAAEFELTTLTSGEAVEYEQRTADEWRWFLMDTNDTAAVVAGLVIQRGSGDNFPRVGLLLLATATAVPPGAVSGADIDPTVYDQFDEEVGPRLQYLWDSPTSPRALTDWKSASIGFDMTATSENPQSAQVPVGRVIIGVRCNEAQWTGSIPGCRYSLTATLLPFVLAQGDAVRAPMARGAVHLFALDMGDYDSLTIEIDRDGVAGPNATGLGLIGAALLHHQRWSPPHTLTFPFNLSGLPPGTPVGDFEISLEETEAMLHWQERQMRTDKGLLYLAGCEQGDAGCRAIPQPNGEGDAYWEVAESGQANLRANLWVRSLPREQGGYAALHAGAGRTELRQLCLGPGSEGRYYLTMVADPVVSGDGRLWAGGGGFYATEFPPLGAPIPGVDTTGWRNQHSPQWPDGCWCCADGVCPAVCAADAAAGCAFREMPPAAARTVRGYSVRVLHTVYSSAAVPVGDRVAGVERLGCVSYGQWRYFSVPTTAVDDAGVLVSLSAEVGGLYAALGRRPTLDDYDVRATPPLRSLTLTACDVTAPATWVIAVQMGDEADGIVETLWSLYLSSRPAGARVGDQIAGSGCCGAFQYWRVTDVPDGLALTANVTVTSGALHGVLLQFDSCPRYDNDDPLLRCGGRCEARWLTTWDRIDGTRHSEAHGAVTVPMGLSLAVNDERRSGSWYVGVKALAEEAATFTLSISLTAPPPLVEPPFCSGNARFCASAAQRAAKPGNLPITTAADARRPPLVVSAATRRYSPRGRLAVVLVATCALLLILLGEPLYALARSRAGALVTHRAAG